MLFLVLAMMMASMASCQRYAERNVLPPAPSPPDHSYDYEDYWEEYAEDEDTYGFREEEEEGVYKWNVEKYPHPVTTPRFCNRLRASHVCDPDLVLDREQADTLDDFTQKLYRETPCICDTCDGEGGGIVVGIALLKHLHHPYHMHHAKVIRSFAETLRSRWKLGRCDNDVLIVVATADRLSYTDVGSATSRYLSVHDAHRIFLENKAKFSAFNFSEGLMDILRGYHRATRGMRDAARESSLDPAFLTGCIVGSVLLIGVLLFLGFVVYRRCQRPKRTDDGDIEKKAPRGGASSVSSSWSKKDIKVLFGPERSSAAYQKCGTDDNDLPSKGAPEDEYMDLTLDNSPRDRTRMSEVTSDSDVLEKELTTAAEGLVKTFPSSSNGRNVLVTDM